MLRYVVKEYIIPLISYVKLQNEVSVLINQTNLVLVFN